MKKFGLVILSIVKYICVFIFIIISFVFMGSYSILESTKQFVSEDNLTNMIKNIDIIEIIGNERKQELYDVLEKTGIPTEYADLMFEDDTLKEYIGSYAATSIGYLVGTEELPKIDEKEITDVLIESFDRVIEEAENHDIQVATYIPENQQEQIRTEIKHYVPEFVDKIPEAEEFIENKINENEKLSDTKRKLEQAELYMKRFQMVYRNRAILLVGAAVAMGLIILLKRKKLGFFKWIAIPFILVFTLFKSMHFVIDQILLKKIPSDLSMFSSITDSFLSLIDGKALIYLIIGVILILIQVIVFIYRKYVKE